MEATLKFNLPEDNIEFVAATQSMKMKYILSEMDQWLRAQTKYAPDDLSEDAYNTYDECRDKLLGLLNQEGISFYE